ncbi:MAG: PHB depolymerase family esterase [Gemmatimonadota bacterium]|jgi:poly(3-hydroxybutyrate) depolymerase/protein-S-isoprenylcysteine O-methyltransferase Ste14
MRRIFSRLYGALGYAAFALSIGYLVGFLADIGVPKTVDRGAGPLGPPLLVDVLLIVAFGLQHSVMARPWFKRLLKQWIPEGLERSTYVLVSGLLLGVVFWLWRPIPMVIWDVSGTLPGTLTWIAYGAGWALAVWATFALSHWHLFGVAQAAAHARGDAPQPPLLRETRLYRIVRHPMTAGLLIAFWSSPQMTLGHAVFAAGMTFYSLWATVLEERDLMDAHPERYRRYRAAVPALLPVLRPGLGLPRRGAFAWEIVIVAALAALPLASIAGASLEPPRPRPTDPPLVPNSLEMGGRTRTFALYDPVPAQSPSRTTAPRPLVLALHGTGGTATRLRGFLGGELERAASERGWLVAYPEALGGVWRDCRLGGEVRTEGPDDDVAFIRKLARHLTETRTADPDRIYALGYSGGGHMAFRLALEGGALVRAVAVFGASPPPPEASKCRPSGDAVPVLMVNGSADPINPFSGGDVIAPTGSVIGRALSSEAGASYLEEVSGGRAEVRLVRIDGGGHVVPGPESHFPSAAGRNESEFRGVREALAFFDHAGTR